MAYKTHSFPPRRFHTLASKLLADSDPDYDHDCKARTALGRFYYAAMLVAFQKLNQEGIPITNSSKIHEDVIRAFNEQNPTIGGLLDQLREKRVEADYYMNSQITLALARKYDLMAERTIRLIDQWKR
jgi:hypothetical protein